MIAAEIAAGMLASFFLLRDLDFLARAESALASSSAASSLVNRLPLTGRLPRPDDVLASSLFLETPDETLTSLLALLFLPNRAWLAV